MKAIFKHKYCKKEIFFSANTGERKQLHVNAIKFLSLHKAWLLSKLIEYRTQMHCHIMRKIN